MDYPIRDQTLRKSEVASPPSSPTSMASPVASYEGANGQGELRVAMAAYGYDYAQMSRTDKLMPKAHAESET